MVMTDTDPYNSVTEQELMEALEESDQIEIHEVDGKKMVPYKQIRHILKDYILIRDQLESYNERLEPAVDFLSECAETLERIHSGDTEQVYSDETWEAVENIGKDSDY